jgi:hypothetical protein
MPTRGVTLPFQVRYAYAAHAGREGINGTKPFRDPETAKLMACDVARRGGSARVVHRDTGEVLGTYEPWPRCKNCSERYDPTDRSDPDYGAFVGPRYCGPCGAAEARMTAADLGMED